MTTKAWSTSRRTYKTTRKCALATLCVLKALKDSRQTLTTTVSYLSLIWRSMWQLAKLPPKKKSTWSIMASPMWLVYRTSHAAQTTIKACRNTWIELAHKSLCANNLSTAAWLGKAFKFRMFCWTLNHSQVVQLRRTYFRVSVCRRTITSGQRTFLQGPLDLWWMRKRSSRQFLTIFLYLRRAMTDDNSTSISTTASSLSTTAPLSSTSMVWDCWICYLH